MQHDRRRNIGRGAAVLAVASTLLSGALIAPAAHAYTSVPNTVYQATDAQWATANKANAVLYPKVAQLESGRLLMTFERSLGEPVGQTLPIYKSDDYGTSWQPLTEVKSPAELTAGTSREADFTKYTSNWTNPYLYTLPQDVGNLKKGTMLLASIVSGDDIYRNDMLAQNADWKPNSDGDRKDMALALYASTDGKGEQWEFLNIVAGGGWEGAYGNHFSSENTNKQNDPVWEPFLMVYDNKLVCYYSDENEYDAADYNSQTGEVTIAADNDTAADPIGQVLVHRTWDGTAAGTWSGLVIDEKGYTFSGGELGKGRPGMTTVAPTTDGKWMMTFEWWGGGTNIQVKIADNPLEFYKVNGQPITNLPNSGGRLATGGSPVLVNLPDGRILYNAPGGGNDVWVNETGASDGVWKRYKTTVGAGYSRNLTYVPQTGRVVIAQGNFGSKTIKAGEVDLGHSAGAYYQLINKKTGLAIGTGGNTQDPPYGNGDKADIVTETADTNAETQYWHALKSDDVEADVGAAVGADDSVTFLNKSGGRSLAVWGGDGSAVLTQWVDDGGVDKSWTLEEAGDGYVRLLNGKTGTYATPSSDAAGAQVGFADKTDDDAQLWKLVAEAEPDPEPEPGPTTPTDPNTPTDPDAGKGEGAGGGQNNQATADNKFGALSLTGSDIAGLAAAGVTLLLIGGIVIALRRRSRLG
ncbi:RICIN domain-containing protein [Bifidobacterium sp. LC6]|uniref:RICIN domain-containing protein n=1 Tax=Bifidobacterium colobi TaxID=2809026 RepID=A0ABS5UV07_9BIFI|nr:RICIN domain-containing protein [Bifidobacterium colobi]MBT1174268.1 RICIN domain-containing protein [Bifidobacterium colobi]